MSIPQRIIVPVLAALALALNGGCLCWLTGDCDQNLTPPADPSPVNGSVDQPISISLSWSGGETESGQSVRQDLFFGATFPPPLYRPSVNGTPVTIGPLSEGRTYYWKVIFIEGDGKNVSGPVWTFTTIYPPKVLSVTYPNWATDWALGETRAIQWRSVYAGSRVRLELYEGGIRLCTIAEEATNDGTYEWVLNDFCAEHTDPDYRIKVTSLQDESLYDYSDFFTISRPCRMSLVAPHQRELWGAQESHAIEWNTLGLGTSTKVQLQLFKGSEFHYWITAITADDGIYEWSVSDFGGGSADDYRVRIQGPNESGCSRFSEFFSIHACPVRVDSPAVETIWPLGTQQTIIWDTTGLPDLISIDLYHDGEFVCTLDDQVPNTGSYLWTVTRCELEFGLDFQIKIHDGTGNLCGFSARFDLH